MAPRPRILILEGPDGSAGWLPASIDWEVVPVPDLGAGLARLGREPFDAVLLPPSHDGIPADLGQAERILAALDDGIAILDPNSTVTWCNPAFRSWCDADPAGRPFLDALGRPPGGDDPFADARGGHTTTFRLNQSRGRHLDVRLTPVIGANGAVVQFIALCQNVSAEVNRQQKLDALHLAGQELSGLSADALSDMPVEDRIELLKINLRRFIHDLLHYDVIEVRLLNRETGKLEPLLAEGMTEEAARRELYAKETDNGVTGLVAATGRSYVCGDAACDPHYIEGAAGARSSLTVPLLVQDQVIGTFNIENPRPNAFTAEDVQFTELFAREIAQALHTLELLTAQQSHTASQSIEAINRELSLPLDDLLATATGLLARLQTTDPEAGEQLRRIIGSARSIRQCIQKVGEDLHPAGEKPGAAAARLKGLRALVVDSDERVRRSAHGILGRFGSIVDAARTGREAVDMAAAGTYDAVLIDIRPPDMTGYEAYRQLREAQPGARMILMTAFGYDASHSIVKARQDGLRLVLFKPFRVDQLLDALIGPEPPPRPRSDAQPEVIQAS